MRETVGGKNREGKRNVDSNWKLLASRTVRREGKRRVRGTLKKTPLLIAPSPSPLLNLIFIVLILLLSFWQRVRWRLL